MLVAKRTKETNIAEHIIYMYQIEDLIRANNFDLERLYHSIIRSQVSDEKIIQEYKEWYQGLVKQMKDQGVLEQGHIQDVEELLMELLMLHNTLLNIVRDKDYAMAYETALPAIKELQYKSKSSNLNVVEVSINALYGKLLLRLKKEKISKETEDAFAQIAKMLSILALNYNKMRNGELNFTQN